MKKEDYDKRMDYFFRNETELYVLFKKSVIVNRIIQQIYLIDGQSLEYAKTKIIQQLDKELNERVNKYIEMMMFKNPEPIFISHEQAKIFREAKESQQQPGAIIPMKRNCWWKLW